MNLVFFYNLYEIVIFISAVPKHVLKIVRFSLKLVSNKLKKVNEWINCWICQPTNKQINTYSILISNKY